MDDLYTLPADGAVLAPLCGGYTGEDGEACVTAGRIPGHDVYLLGDSKRPDAAPLRFTGAELEAAGIDVSKVA
ncbi:DUF397 domain-containing protein [Sinosporangium siamense]|uniref:DUF397 domain-containing protein n=1 Tax=Sinosporangium siamense TaxID=1367973 RepID=A0A919V4L5_9ACTN|nr:DUF397 domain-containing protein [Sinosporangium siamense]GII90633.1 hypothetical protein Ssi02_08640 [Sinosporangium siamense]